MNKQAALLARESPMTAVEAKSLLQQGCSLEVARRLVEGSVAAGIDPNVHALTVLSQMLRLFKDGMSADGQEVHVTYDAQWRTLFKAQRLGLLDSNSRLTEAGKRWIQGLWEG